MREKPKICHIGGAHSVHLSDVIQELDKLGYSQCIISYMPKEQSVTPKHIPVYHYPYRSYHGPKPFDVPRLRSALRSIFKVEQPDLIHGHSLTYSCIATWLAKETFGYPTCVMPWSSQTIKKPTKKSKYYESLCIKSVDYFLHGMAHMVKVFEDFYGVRLSDKYVMFRPLIDLSFYEEQRISSDKPKILSPRSMVPHYNQEFLVRAIPSLLRKYPDLEVTFVIGQSVQDGRPYFYKMQELAKRLKISKFCKFIGKRLTQPAFAELIKAHNIIYSLSTHDSGFAGTNVQALFSGAVTLIYDAFETRELIQHKEHLLRVDLDQKKIIHSLLYIIEHLFELQEKFKSERERYRKYGKEITLKNLISCYERMFDAKD